MNNIRGVGRNKPYLDLTNYIDLKSYDALLPEIYKGLTTARHLSVDSFHTTRPNSGNPIGFKAVYEAYKELHKLPEDHPLRKSAEGLDHNQLTTYLKYAMGGYDLYFKLVLFEDCRHEIILTETANHFPGLMEWILDLKIKNIFEAIECAGFFLLEAGGIPLEHRDPAPPGKSTDDVPEFIHIKASLDRPFFLVDPETREKVHINTRVSWWNEQDWHGGDPVLKPTFALRVDGIFTDQFREKIFQNA
jgi:hypothetical protein